MADPNVKAVMDARADDATAKRRLTARIRTIALSVGFIVLVLIVNALTRGDLLEPTNLSHVLRQITVNVILAVGQTFVIITAGIDLSVGSLIGVCGMAMAIVANTLHIGGPAAFLVTLVVGLAIGCASGWINAQPVVRLGLPPFITTLAMMQVARGLAFILGHGQSIPLNDSTPFDWLGSGYVFAGIFGFVGIPWAVIVMAVVGLVFAVILGRTAYGRYVLADGGNEEAARLAGIDTRRVKTLVYVISGGCAALGGLLLMAQFSAGTPQAGTGAELQCIAAVVVGGTSLMGGRGSIIGTFFGALLIGVLNNVMNLLHIEAYTQQIVLGAVILLALILDALRKRYFGAR